MARRLAREKVYALYMEIFGQFGFSGGPLVTVEPFDNSAVHQADLRRYF